MQLKEYLIGGLIGAFSIIGIWAINDYQINQAYLFKENNPNNGKQELFIRTTNPSKEYRINKDSSGEITGFSELKNLESKTSNK